MSQKLSKCQQPVVDQLKAGKELAASSSNVSLGTFRWKGTKDSVLLATILSLKRKGIVKTEKIDYRVHHGGYPYDVQKTVVRLLP